ncbi:Procollagen C-endopeptidase enhancer 2 [Bulinus truncatus]|nr:Procollagen C-endopeptidase enhancer 2 [Bulinus truncatus]
MVFCTHQIKDSTCMLSRKTGSDIGKLLHQGLSQVHHFELKPSLDCGGEIINSQGDFASPGWPRNYTHHLNCTWTIRVPEHKVIMFTFIHFDLGKRQPNPCGQVSDRLRISEVTPQGEFRFCASPPMTTYISKTNVATFNFLTNGNADAQGFKVVFKGDWPCRAVFKSDRGEIASPQWPEQYLPGLSCVWTIQAPEGGKITLKFTTIDLDSQSYGGCTDQHDHIDVFDGPSAINRVARYCAHEAPAPILSTGNALLVTFKTDGYVQRTGFHASYDFLLPAAEPTTRPPPTATTTPLPRPRYGAADDDDDDNNNDGSSSNNGGYDQSELLTAKFIEPRSERERSQVNVTFLADSVFNFGIEGGGYIQPKQQIEEDESNFSSDTYITILWIVLVSLLVITVVLTLVLVVVCKHNRSRAEKRKDVEKYTYNREESLSLYEKESTTPKVYDDDFDSIRAFPNETDISFSNPLYRGCHTAPPRRSEITLVSACDALSDSGCSSSNNSARQGSTALLTSPC